MRALVSMSTAQGSTRSLKAVGEDGKKAKIGGGPQNWEERNMGGGGKGQGREVLTRGLKGGKPGSGGGEGDTEGGRRLSSDPPGEGSWAGGDGGLKAGKVGSGGGDGGMLSCGGSTYGLGDGKAVGL
jgi:hypothetical protein